MKTLTLEQVEALIRIMDLENVFNNLLFEGGEVWQEDEEDDTNHLENFINEIVEKELNYNEIIELFNEKKEVIKIIKRIRMNNEKKI